MLKILTALLFLSLIVFGGCSSFKAPSDSDILGIKIGMNKEDAAKRLNEIGKLEKEESKQQEVWALTNDSHYSYLIVAFNKETQKVRFITAKARENGSRLRYTDVLDIGKAQQTSSANNYKYSQEVPGSAFTSGYTKIASGADSNYLTYFSLKELNSSDEEEDDDEK
jgi:hypothetical protein